jgi:hypothetical protein
MDIAPVNIDETGTNIMENEQAVSTSDGWHEWRRHILIELERLNDNYSSIKDNMVTKDDLKEVRDRVDDNAKTISSFAPSRNEWVDLREKVKVHDEKISSLSITVSLIKQRLETFIPEVPTWKWLLERFGLPIVTAIVTAVLVMVITNGI